MGFLCRSFKVCLGKAACKNVIVIVIVIDGSVIVIVIVILKFQSNSNSNRNRSPVIDPIPDSKCPVKGPPSYWGCPGRLTVRSFTGTQPRA